MTQNNHRAIIEFPGVIRQQFDFTIQWRKHRRSGNTEQIQPQVDGPFFCGAVTGEIIAVIQIAWLGITAERESGSCVRHRFVNQHAKLCGVQISDSPATQSATATQVQYDRIAVGVDDRRCITELHVVAERGQKDQLPAGQIRARFFR